ncbi:3-hydroxyisobutyrate dehydrogenase [Parasaccharibacter apium]|uniref:3-hydroxyisobutyrate dehydrogenase n=1 Tax=Parasaccharibacter apium TaxID=1510841 RepID=A0A7U7G6T6_9PROT|nr:NAD(P)-dependent oxidoreductase [Parasaccharibacter apium]CDG34181.1 3-hydroxyisobutyrate dehydrogenase [Parasaccharibacter apium]
MSIKTIGFIGYGAMASLMGRNLVRAGYDVIAHTPSGRSNGAEADVPMLASPRLVAERSDAIIICVPNDEAENTALHGPDGLLAGLRSGQLVLDTSTVSPEQADHLAALLGERNVAVLDARMSGSTPEAEKGALIMLVGGPEETVTLARPILDHIGRITIHAGPAGSATRLKLVVNGIMGGTLNIIAEGIAYGLAAGVERSVLFDALQELAVISPHHKRKIGMGKAGHFPSQFPTRLMSKDMGLLMEAARRCGVPMHGMAAASQNLAASNRNHADDDYSALIARMEREAANR